TLGQIHTSWQMGGSKGNSPAHKNFPDQMAEKTVIARALKIATGSSDDSTIVANRESDKVSADVKQEMKEKANTKVVDFEEAEIVDESTGEVNPPQESAEQNTQPANAPF